MNIKKGDTVGEAIQASGLAIWGDDWLSPMADELGVRRDTLAKWATGKRRPLPPDVWPRLGELLLKVEASCFEAKAALLKVDGDAINHAIR